MSIFIAFPGGANVQPELRTTRNLKGIELCRLRTSPNASQSSLSGIKGIEFSKSKLSRVFSTCLPIANISKGREGGAEQPKGSVQAGTELADAKGPTTCKPGHHTTEARKPALGPRNKGNAHWRPTTSPFGACPHLLSESCPGPLHRGIIWSSWVGVESYPTQCFIR